MLVIISVIILIFIGGIRIINPTERGVILLLGKYQRFAKEGFNWIIPVFNTVRQINITQEMVNIDQQEIITSDNLNARTSLVVFYKINEDEESVKKALFKVSNVRSQIVTLAQTTARNVMGQFSFTKVNSERNELNKKIFDSISIEASSKYGVSIVKVELKEIEPPKDVQDAMNRVIKAENLKISAINEATALETSADGNRRASIKEAEGERQARILRAEGEAKAFALINESFVGNAQLLEKLKVVENCLKDNTKIVLNGNNELINVIGDLSGVLPIKNKSKTVN